MIQKYFVTFIIKAPNAYKLSISRSISLSFISSAFHNSLTYLFAIDFLMCFLLKVELHFLTQIKVFHALTHYYKIFNGL